MGLIGVKGLPCRARQARALHVLVAAGAHLGLAQPCPVVEAGSATIWGMSAQLRWVLRWCGCSTEVCHCGSS